MSKNAKDELGKFISIVQESFQKLLRKHKIALCTIFLAVFLLGCSLSILLESLFYFGVIKKFTIVFLVLLLSLVAAIYAYYQLKIPSFTEFYHQFSKEKDTPELSNALDLHFDNDAGKSPLHLPAIHQNIGVLNPKSITTGLNSFTHNHTINSYYRNGLIGNFAGFLLLTALISFQPDAVNRLVHLWNAYSRPNPYQFTVEPGSLTLEQGSSFTPEIHFTGDVPGDLSLAFKTDIEEKFRKRNPESTKNKKVVFSPISPSTNGRYYFLMNGFKSDTYQFMVQLRPRFEQLSVHVIPTAYTKLDTMSYAYPFAKVTAYPGSEVVLSARANKPLSSLLLSRSAADSVALSQDSTNSAAFSHRWLFESIDTVSFTMRDRAGLSNENPFQFIIEPLNDQKPFVDLIDPNENLEMKTPESLQIKYKAGDDFGLTAASLHYKIQRAFTENPESGSISLQQPVMNQPQNYKWDIPNLNPKPRDVVTYWIEVEDNDAYNGAKTGRSQKLIITFPSVTEYLNELNSREENAAESLESISESFAQMQQEYDRFKQQLRQNPEAEWEQKQQLQKTRQQQQKIDEQLEKLNSTFRKIREEIQENELMSSETMEAYKELQELMQEINNPELATALKKLRQSLGEMDPGQLRQALKDYEFNEKLYKERIQRTIELFRSLKLNSDLEKMAVALDRLAKLEQQVVEATDIQKEFEQQKAIQKDLRDVQKQLKELGKNVSENTKSSIQKLQNNAEQKLKKINQDLQQNVEQLKHKQQKNDAGEEKSKIKRQQQQIQQQMQQISKQVRSAKKQLTQQQRQINAAALKYILYSLINLSQKQEELVKETESLPYQSKAFVEHARKEQNIRRQFSMLADSLFQLSSELPSFSNQINKKKSEVENQLQQSVELLAERDKQSSVQALKRSLGNVNSLASMIASLLDQMQNMPPGGSGGAMSMQQFIEQLQKMTGQQQKLNRQIQQMINNIQGNRLTRSQMERLKQLSSQQNQIRKQLEEMRRKGVLESGDRLLSELERMSESMEDAINDLRGGQLDRPFRQRQQNILSRMLSAEKALQERGKEKQRKAESAQTSPQSNPPDITLEELHQQIREMLNNPNQTKFREDYQRLIEQYFELLKKQVDEE